MSIFHEGPIDNMSPLVKIKASRPIDNKLLAESMTTQFTDVYVHPWAPVS